MNIRLIFGLIVLIMLASTIGLLALVEIPKSNENTFVQMVGTLSTLAGLVIGYYFGSSDGSRRKTDMLAEQSTQATGKPGDPVHVAEEEK